MNHGMDGAGRHLWRSASPTPQFKEGQSKLLRSIKVLNNAKYGTTSSVQPFSAPSSSEHKHFCLCFNSVVCIKIHAYILLFIHLKDSGFIFFMLSH